MKDYWSLDQNATFRDLILCIRADEAVHREVNKDFSILAENLLFNLTSVSSYVFCTISIHEAKKIQYITKYISL